MNAEQEGALAELKSQFAQCAIDGEAEINGTIYRFGQMTTEEELTVLAFFESHGHSPSNLSFVLDDRWPRIRELLFRRVTVDDRQIAKIPNFWDARENKPDLLPLITTMVGVISHAFQVGGGGA